MTAARNNTSPSPSSSEVSDTLTLLKEWVARNKGVLEIFLDAYCVVTLDNRVVEFNTAFTELCGESYRKILKIGNFCELIKTEKCPSQCPAKLIFTSEKSMRVDELHGASKAYPQLEMILGGVPIYSPDEKLLGALITIRNVSAEAELQKKYDERKKDSITDGLTRLFNKVYTENVLLRMIKSNARDNGQLSLVMCDIDHFKQVNDVYGHPAGDHVLAIVAQMLKGEARDTDIIGRFGGEEFVAILHNSDSNGAKIFCERFRKRVEGAQILYEGKHIPVTVSLGTSFQKGGGYPPTMTPEAVMKEIVNQADTALYLAKANGRNRTFQFEDVPKKKS